MTDTTAAKISAVIARTKAHKDTFVIPQLLEIMESYIKAEHDEDTSPEELVVKFVAQTADILVLSPIYSDVLMREFYRHVLISVDTQGWKKDAILEDLLFQSLRRGVDHDKSKRKRQKDARSRIMQVALEEFSDKGYHATTIDSIAERAGIAKGTLYRHFSTKEGLFNALKEDTITEFVEMARKDLSKEEDILKIIDNIVKIYLGFFENNSSFYKVLIQEHKDFGRDFSDKFISELILGLPGLKRRCWKASRTGQLKQMNYFTVFFGIIGFLNGIIQKWLHDGGEGSLLDEVETVTEVLFYGIVAADGNLDEPTLKVIS